MLKGIITEEAALILDTVKYLSNSSFALKMSPERVQRYPISIHLFLGHRHLRLCRGLLDECHEIRFPPAALYLLLSHVFNVFFGLYRLIKLNFPEVPRL